MRSTQSAWGVQDDRQVEQSLNKHKENHKDKHKEHTWFLGCTGGQGKEHEGMDQTKFIVVSTWSLISKPWVQSFTLKDLDPWSLSPLPSSLCGPSKIYPKHSLPQACQRRPINVYTVHNKDTMSTDLYLNMDASWERAFPWSHQLKPRQIVL